jgi:hypothetical protein
MAFASRAMVNALQLASCCLLPDRWLLLFFTVLKERMKKVRGREAKRLTELTGSFLQTSALFVTRVCSVVSREALTTNEGHLTQAERILQLAELSRKMETEREKVQPPATVDSKADNALSFCIRSCLSTSPRCNLFQQSPKL